jgi:hypothetical protein
MRSCWRDCWDCSPAWRHARPRPATITTGDGYRYERPYRPYYSGYSSNCCYRKAVRYARTYRDYDRPYFRPSYRSSYYDRPYYRPYYRSAYYDRPSYYDSGWRYGRPYYERPYVSSYYTTSYDPYYYPRYRSYYPDSRYYSSPSYYGGYSRPHYYNAGWSSYSSNWDQPRSFYPEGCRRSKVYDDAGGWVRGNSLSCGH